MVSLNDLKVYVGSFTFGKKSKRYPYPMVREIDLKESIKELKKEFTTRSSVLTPRDSNWVLSKIDKVFGDALATDGETQGEKS